MRRMILAAVFIGSLEAQAPSVVGFTDPQCVGNGMALWSPAPSGVKPGGELYLALLSPGQLNFLAFGCSIRPGSGCSLRTSGEVTVLLTAVPLSSSLFLSKFRMALPNSAALVGFEFSAQVGAVDPKAPWVTAPKWNAGDHLAQNGSAFSNLLWITVGK